jgi:hypothetical protein
MFVCCEKNDAELTAGPQRVATIPANDTLRDIITENILLTNIHPWYIDGWVFVTNEAILEIEPGTEIIFLGNKSRHSGLVITRGAKIEAIGEPASPIRFRPQISAGKPAGWMGVVLLGRAPQRRTFNVYEHPFLPEGIGLSYGGNLPEDNSGILRYVYIDYIPVKNNEIPPGLLMLGTGSGTDVRDLRLRAGKAPEIYKQWVRTSRISRE